MPRLFLSIEIERSLGFPDIDMDLVIKEQCGLARFVSGQRKAASTANASKSLELQ